MDEELRDGDKVYIIPVQEEGTVSGGITTMSNYWVDYDNEYGGKFWYKDDLKLIEQCS